MNTWDGTLCCLLWSVYHLMILSSLPPEVSVLRLLLFTDTFLLAVGMHRPSCSSILFATISAALSTHKISLLKKWIRKTLINKKYQT